MPRLTSEDGERRRAAVRGRREIEDLEALIAEAGGSAHVLGVSSGGALARFYGTAT
jgi:hypothetical protein